MGKVLNFKSQVNNLNFSQTIDGKIIICPKKNGEFDILKILVKGTVGDVCGHGTWWPRNEVGPLNTWVY